MKTDPDDFIDYYYLKEELIAFCRENGLPVSGSKRNITDRIHVYLKTGKVVTPKKRSVRRVIDDDDSPLSLDAIVPKRYKSDERHRAFFKSVIGDHFKFNVSFMNWMKENTGKTYREAVTEWQRIDKEKKNGVKTEISPQFEYNQYTRDFFGDNKNGTREEAIKCWKHKKSLPGHNRYEKVDLDIL